MTLPPSAISGEMRNESWTTRVFYLKHGNLSGQNHIVTRDGLFIDIAVSPCMIESCSRCSVDQSLADLESSHHVSSPLFLP